MFNFCKEMICKIAYNLKYMTIDTIVLQKLIDKYYNQKNTVTNSIDTEYLKALRKACDEYIEIMKIERMKNDNYNKELENILLKKGS